MNCSTDRQPTKYVRVNRPKCTREVKKRVQAGWRQVSGAICERRMSEREGLKDGGVICYDVWFGVWE